VFVLLVVLVDGVVVVFLLVELLEDVPLVPEVELFPVLLLLLLVVDVLVEALVAAAASSAAASSAAAASAAAFSACVLRSVS